MVNLGIELDLRDGTNGREGKKSERIAKCNAERCERSSAKQACVDASWVRTLGGLKGYSVGKRMSKTNTPFS